MGNRRKPRSASPLRAALAAKTNLRTFHDIAVVSSEEVQEAVTEHARADQLFTASLLHEDDAVRERATEMLVAAKERRDACFHRIWFRGLGPNEWDALVALHPPTEEQAERGRPQNNDTLIFGLLAECALEPDGSPTDLTAEEWEAEMAHPEKWSAADVARVKTMAFAAQRQTMADAVPKGF